MEKSPPGEKDIETFSKHQNNNNNLKIEQFIPQVQYIKNRHRQVTVIFSKRKSNI